MEASTVRPAVIILRHGRSFRRIFRFTADRHDPMRLIRPSLTAMLVIGVALLGSSCATPRAQATLMQELNDAASEINGLKGDIANLQTQLDSMRTILAKHDTSITRIANINNVPIAR